MKIIAGGKRSTSNWKATPAKHGGNGPDVRHFQGVNLLAIYPYLDGSNRFVTHGYSRSRMEDFMAAESSSVGDGKRHSGIFRFADRLP